MTSLLSSTGPTSAGKKRRRKAATKASVSELVPTSAVATDKNQDLKTVLVDGGVDVHDNIIKKKDDDLHNATSITDPDGGGGGGGIILFKYWLIKQWAILRIKIPALQRLEALFMKIPPRMRKLLLVLWFGKWIWLSLGFLLVTFIQQQAQQQVQQSQHRISGHPGIGKFLRAGEIASVGSIANRTLWSTGGRSPAASATTPLKVLYVVTSLAEYNNGRRATVKGSDRFLNLMIPVLMDGIETMVASTPTVPGGSIDLHVDLFLITAYELRQERQQLIRDRLKAIAKRHTASREYGFQFWDNAVPLGYTSDGQSTMGINATREKLRYNTRALARQHRYVVRDKIEYYDMFASFEDDMRITRQHIEHFWNSSVEIEKLRLTAPTSITSETMKDKDGHPKEEIDDVEHFENTKFFGRMTRRQLDRVLPGFVRVEVLTNATDRSNQNEPEPLPLAVDYEFEVDTATSSSTTKRLEHHEIDPSICCHVSIEEQKEMNTPKQPQADDLVIWETNTMAFSLRQFPPGTSKLLEWSVLMLGPDKFLKNEEKVGGYWSGRDGAFGELKKPSGAPPDLLAQQGGWMATREQLVRMNNYLCRAPFLPPFDYVDPMRDDGLEPHNVEFWSGSYQFFTGGKNHCNMQRVISMNPEHFSKHLVYHAANNKQKQVNTKRRMVKANQIFGQLNTVLKNAKLALDKEKEGYS